MASFDGTSKSVGGKGQSIKYFEPTSPRLDALKQQVISNASPEAIRFIDPLNCKAPTVVVDASTLTDIEWQKIRENSIGSSAVSNVFGDCPYPNCTNLDLYYSKIGQKPMITDDDDDRDLLFLYGHLMEEFLHLYTRKKFRTSELIIDTNIYSDPLRPYITANLDGMMRRSDGTYVHIEYKTSSEFNEDAFANGAIPPYYKRQLIQCQHILEVWESYLIVAFSRDNIIVRRYVRDLDEEMEQLIGVDDFWNNHVLPQIPPIPVGPSANVLASICKYSGYGNSSIPELSLSAFQYDAVEKLENVIGNIRVLDAQKKRLQAEKDALIIPVAQAMLQGIKAYVSNGKRAFTITWKPRAGARTCDFERLELDYPDIYAQYVSKKEEGSRPMTVKEIDVRP